MNLHLRGLKVKLECGHTAVITTSFFRLSRSRASVIYGDSLWPRGVSCLQCGRDKAPVEYLGTCRQDSNEREWKEP